MTTLDGQSSVPGAASTFQYYESGAGGAVPTVTGVTPYGGSENAPEPVTILGADFQAGDGVSFGGQPAAAVRVLDPGRIVATPAAYSPATKCSPLPARVPYSGEDAANDICQVEVLVTGPGGTSRPAKSCRPSRVPRPTNRTAGCAGPPAAAARSIRRRPSTTTRHRRHLVGVDLAGPTRDGQRDRRLARHDPRDRARAVHVRLAHFDSPSSKRCSKSKTSTPRSPTSPAPKSARSARDRGRRSDRRVFARDRSGSHCARSPAKPEAPITYAGIPSGQGVKIPPILGGSKDCPDFPQRRPAAGRSWPGIAGQVLQARLESPMAASKRRAKTSACRPRRHRV